MNRNVVYVLVLVLFIYINSVCAQAPKQLSSKSKAAVSLYMESKSAINTSERISLLKKSLGKDARFVEAYWEMARIYMQIDQFDKAIACLEEANSLNLPFADETKHRLSVAYFGNGQYQKALNICNQISDEFDAQQKKKLIEKYEYALKLYNDALVLNPKNLVAINTEYDDYFPSITADGKMLSTTVLVPELAYDGAEHFQEDLYLAYSEDGVWKRSRPVINVNTVGNEGSQSFSADGRYMFFVICNAEDGLGSCDIYYSIKRGKTWSSPINLGAPVNSEYWESCPAITPTADKIYFSTNRPGGLGKSDIWTADVKIMDNGYLKVSNARSLGAPINTAGDEFSPYIHADNQTLYYSSDGRNGLGRCDIYISRKGANGKWGEPTNLGYPINSHGQESGFVVNGRGNKAYFSSDKIEKNGKKLDIYEIDLPEQFRPTPMAFIVGQIVDAETHKPVQAHVEIFDRTSNEKFFESISDTEDGEFVAVLPADGVYGLSIEKRQYMFYTTPINELGDTIFVELQKVEQGATATMNNLYFAYNSDKILETSNAEIIHLTDFMNKNKYVSIEIVGHTDNIGSAGYNLDLSLRRANALRTALVNNGISESRITIVGKGSEMPVESNATEEGRAKNRRVEISIL